MSFESPSSMKAQATLRSMGTSRLMRSSHPKAPMVLHEWDRGVFDRELVSLAITPRAVLPTDGDLPRAMPAMPRIQEGTIEGTKLALTEMYKRIESRWGAFFDMANFESSVPQDIAFAAKKDLYTFQAPNSDEYPPHLEKIPASDTTGLLSIFDASRLADTAAVLLSLIPIFFPHADPTAKTLEGITIRNKQLVDEKRDIFTEPNVGLRESDWFSDEVFAGQQFTGTNPTTITIASPDLLQEFAAAAQSQQNTAVLNVINSSGDSLYVQDCRYFREAIGVSADFNMTSTDGKRHACAAVSLFLLNPVGKLHPLAVVIDYKKTMQNSVVLFNQRLSPDDPTDSEASDWPWRYAKMCAQISDWTRHELTVHLTNTHLVEEVIIVAVHRTVPVNHPIFQQLSPHWLKTLSLNAAARSTLVPSVINRLVGFTDEQTYAFVRHAYNTFDWTAGYIPNDMNKRGFPMDQLGSDVKFHNYAYGKNMALMWNVLRTFVDSSMSAYYKTDAEVAGDPVITAWCNEMRSPTGGDMASFPSSLPTRAALVDALTMCIHIASPQHTAINYLQDFYHAFLPNKPAALCKSPPTTLAALQAWKEQDIMDSLPVDRPQQWLLSTHLTHLLSYRVAKDQNLLTYAVSLSRVAKDPIIQAAAEKLYLDLVQLKKTFDVINDELDDPLIDYHVMDPEVTAISILL